MRNEPFVAARRCGPSERIVFEAYSRQTYEEIFQGVAERDNFERLTIGPGRYDN